MRLRILGTRATQQASLLFLACSLASAAAEPGPTHRLAGHVPASVAGLAPTGRLPGERRLNLAIGLPLRNRAALTNLLAQLYDPASTNYHRYLTPAQFAQRFGPSEQDYESVVAFAQTNGFVVTGRHSNRALLNVNAAVADIERAFQLTLRTYKHPVEARDFHAPDAEPAVDAALPILDLSGLDNYARPHPKHLKPRPLGQQGSPRAKDGSGPEGMFIGQDYRAAYLPGVALTGAGQIVGLLEFDGYYASDIIAYASQAGLTNVPLANVLLDFDGTPGDSNSEVALDIEMVMSMAPGLSQIVVYEAGPNGTANDVLSAMATNTAMKQIGCSWDFGTGPSGTTDNYFRQFKAQGQSFFDASGDSGAYSGSIPFPDDDPNITIVGGTSLATSGLGGSWIGETAWSDGGEEASSGGSSSFYSLPAWQQGVSTSANGGSTTKRNIPDVAMVADNIFIVADNGQYEGTGGTSASAQLWAGVAALANEQAAAYGNPPIGFINPAIYGLGKGPSFSACFNDITLGDSSTNGSPGPFYAVSGFDLCTGWGTPNGISLLLALASPDPLLVLPGRGFVANGPAGGPFNLSAQTFVLTNAGTNVLSWSLGNTSVWLTTSVANGTLSPRGAAATVTVALNPAANSLVPGSYATSVWFTNLTSGVGQNREFTLLVGQNLVQNGGFEAGDLSWWSPLGSEGSAYNYADDGTYSNINPYDGVYLAALGQTRSVAYLSQTLATRAGQPYLLSFFLDSPDQSSPNQFVVQWNTNILYNQSNLGALDWTNMQFVVTATGPTSTLTFGFRNDPAAFGLDDISVVPTNGLQTGSLEVSLKPPGAVSAGAQWQVDSGAWQKSGATVSNLTDGNHTLGFLTVSNWVTPTNQTVVVNGGQTALATGTYAPSGALRVTLAPPAAVSDGAQWQVDSGAWQKSGATVSSLAGGKHTVSFSAVSGWTTPTNLVVTVSTNKTTSAAGTYLGTLSLSAAPAAGGKVSGGGVFTVPSSHTAGAVAGAGYLFANWTENGAVVSANNHYSFTLYSNRTLVANFATNLFPLLKGPYAGLFYDSHTPTPTNAGYFSAALTAQGGLSGKLSLGGTNYSFSGAFSPTGVYSNTVPRGRQSSLLLYAQLDLASGLITNGWVSDGVWTATLYAFRAPYSSANPAPAAGKYTFAIARGTDATVAPAGYGYGAVTVDGLGNVSFAGTLGDTTNVTQSAVLCGQNLWPLCLAPYSGRGVVLGWLSFERESRSDLDGPVTWIKQPQPGAKLYPSGFGFTNLLGAMGSVYTNGGLSVGNWEVVLRGGNVGTGWTNYFTVGAGGKVSGTNLSLKPLTTGGLFQGTLSKTPLGRPISFGGALVEKLNGGFGSFAGTNQSGSVELLPR